MKVREEGGTCHNDKPGQGARKPKIEGGRSIWWSYFLPFPLAAGAKTAGGGVDARSSLPLCLPRPWPCPFLPSPLPLSGALPLPLPLAMSESKGLKSRISREREVFFLIAGCIGSIGYWQSLTTRE